MTSARDILNKLTWDKRFSTQNYAVVFVHRGAPHDLKVVKASAIREKGKSFFMIEEDTMIPYHRIRAIRDLKSGEDIYSKNEGVPFPLREIEGQEGLGEFQDEAHSGTRIELDGEYGSTIRCAARLSFPEGDPESFRARVRDGVTKFGLVELSFFRYTGEPEESERYESMVDFASKVIAEAHLDVISLHLPSINILNRSRTRRMLDTFLPFCTQVDCKSIVVHPGILDVQHLSKLDRIRARSDLAEFLKSISRELSESKIILSIETYPEQNRVPSGTPDMHDFVSALSPSCQIAYDTSHTMGSTDSVVEDIIRCIEKINVFHFSNRCRDERHMPIFSSRGDLNFTSIIDAIKSAGFEGMIVLEYQPKKYRMLLERDLRSLRDAIRQRATC
ncbi:MAG: RNA repair domain-containing protein [Promethearchaeati archaeon SRVP18_Atabeyarchaeia-1]